jgi:AbrB family looped-hinge helix DNA binding protein
MVMAVVLAIYGFVDLILLLAATVIKEWVKPIFHAVGIGSWKRMSHNEDAIARTCQLEEPIVRITRISAKGRVTIPAELRERFGLRKGTRIDWKKDGGRLVLTPVTSRRKKF